MGKYTACQCNTHILPIVVITLVIRGLIRGLKEVVHGLMNGLTHRKTWGGGWGAQNGLALVWAYIDRTFVNIYVLPMLGTT